MGPVGLEMATSAFLKNLMNAPHTPFIGKMSSFGYYSHLSMRLKGALLSSVAYLEKKNLLQKH